MDKLVKESSVSKTSKGSQSVRTTVPKEVAEIFNLNNKDKLVWEIDFSGEGVTVYVRPK